MLFEQAGVEVKLGPGSFYGRFDELSHKHLK
jgi:hypothetical protein